MHNHEAPAHRKLILRSLLICWLIILGGYLLIRMVFLVFGLQLHLTAQGICLAFPVINTTCKLSCGLMIATICNNFVSSFVWGVCFSKVQSFKGENGCKVLISVISIALQTLNILL